MSIPDYQTIMFPLLQFAGDGKEHTMREAIDALAKEFLLTLEEREALVPSGQGLVFDNRVSWARTYMKEAGLLEAPRRGIIHITERGMQVLQEKPDRIGVNFLNRYEEFRQFRARAQYGKAGHKKVDEQATRESTATPEEMFATAFEALEQRLASDLLEQVQKASPGFFERLVVQLLVAMGYGGTFKEAAQAVGQSGDEGIDGIINQDRLGLEVVYVQAKRWAATVGRPELQKFVGALAGKNANKGVFITTSSFTAEAQNYAGSVHQKIVLIDGQRLVDLMIEHNVGVSITVTYEIKKVDSDFFVEE
jgi:restriction system protein